MHMTKKKTKFIATALLISMLCSLLISATYVNATPTNEQITNTENTSSQSQEVNVPTRDLLKSKGRFEAVDGKIVLDSNDLVILADKVDKLKDKCK